MFKTPFILPLFYPELVWKKNTQDKVIYLTFDDGPIPEVTEFVSKNLAKFDAKATFFCIGENVVRYPELLSKLIDDEHSIGNHTHNHLNGWKTPPQEYCDNVAKCDAILQEHGVMTKLFRPPYGQIKKSQIRTLITDYELIMWDVLSKDYNHKISQETAWQQCQKHTSPGSIVVFHDSLKAAATMQYVLPRFLEHFSSLGYRFDKLNMVW